MSNKSQLDIREYRMYENQKPLVKKLLEPPRPCPSQMCTSSDGFKIYEKTYADGGKVIDGYCFSCDTDSRDPYGDLLRSEVPHAVRTPPPLVNSPAPPPREYVSSKMSVEDGSAHPIRGISSRGIDYATAEYFNVRVGVSSTDGSTPIYTLFPRYRKESLVGWKTRTEDKRFFSTGGSDIDLFGAHLCKPQGKKIYITEGEIDAMSLYQSLKEGSSFSDYHPSVISLSDGCSSALKSLAASGDLLDEYSELVLCFDNDEPGKAARDTICKAYAGKVSYITIPLPYKDANDMLMAGKSNQLKWLALTGAKKYHPDGIVAVKGLKGQLHEAAASQVIYPYPPFMQELNLKLYGTRPGTIVTVTAGTSVGKTNFLREIMYHYLMTTDEKIAGMYLEEDKFETIRGLMALHLNKRIHLPDVKTTEEEENEAFDALFDSDRMSLYDFFGGMDDSSLLSKLRYYAITGHKFIFLDHLSFVISEDATEGDERKKIDVLMNKLAKFAKEFGIVLFLVVHLRKTDSKGIPFELGAVPALDDLKGSSALKQASWDVIGLSRNQQHRNNYCANTTEISVLKARFTGETGVADYLYFNNITGRLMSVECPAGYREGKSLGRGNF